MKMKIENIVNAIYGVILLAGACTLSIGYVTNDVKSMETGAGVLMVGTAAMTMLGKPLGDKYNNIIEALYQNLN